MKIFAIVALICLASAAKGDIVHNGEDFLEAFYKEAFGVDLLLSECEHDTNNVIDVVQTAFDMIDDWTSPVQWTKVSIYLVKHKEDFQVTYADCASAGKDFVAGLDAMTPLLNPITLTTALYKAELHHPIAFPRNIIKMKNAWADHDYKRSGKYAGKDTKYLLDEVMALQNTWVNDFEQFMDNFWFYALDIPLALEGCTKNSQSAFQVIQDVLYLLTDRSSTIETTRAIIRIKKHWRDFQYAFEDCTHAAPQLVRGTKKLWPLHDISAAATATTQAIKHHPIGFPNNLRKARKAFDDGEYGDAGKYSGIDTHYILDEME